MIVECTQCGAAELMDEERFGNRAKLEVECPQCGHISVLRAPGQSGKSLGKGKNLPEIQHTGMTTVVEVRTRLPEGKKVAIVAMNGPVKGAIFPITKPEMVLGRVGADLLISDTQISAKHCTLEIRESIGILRDLGSTNGIYVGNKQVKTTTLEHLSEFRIGATTFMFTVTALE